MKGGRDWAVHVRQSEHGGVMAWQAPPPTPYVPAWVPSGAGEQEDHPVQAPSPAAVHAYPPVLWRARTNICALHTGDIGPHHYTLGGRG